MAASATQPPNPFHRPVAGGRRPPWAALFPAPRLLAREVAELDAELASLARRAAANGAGGQEVPAWLASAWAALAAAEREGPGGLTGSGLAWSHLHAARRESLRGYQAAGELGIKAGVVLAQSRERLSGWAQAAVLELLDGPGEPGLAEVTAASDVLHDRLAAERRVGFAYERQLWSLAVASFFLAALLGLFVWTPQYVGPVELPFFFAAVPVSLDSWPLMVSILLTGMLGGAVSGAYSLLALRPRGEDASRLVAGWLTMARVVIGGAAALAVFTFLISGLLNLPPLTPELALSIAFVSGFSERVLTGAVGRAAAAAEGG